MYQTQAREVFWRQGGRATVTRDRATFSLTQVCWETHSRNGFEVVEVETSTQRRHLLYTLLPFFFVGVFGFLFLNRGHVHGSKVLVFRKILVKRIGWVYLEGLG